MYNTIQNKLLNISYLLQISFLLTVYDTIQNTTLFQAFVVKSNIKQRGNLKLMMRT